MQNPTASTPKSRAPCRWPARKRPTADTKATGLRRVCLSALCQKWFTYMHPSFGVVSVCACGRVSLRVSIQLLRAQGFLNTVPRPQYYIMSVVLPLVGEGNGSPAPESNPPLPLPLDKPQIGDRVLVLREPWLTKVLTGEKTVEIRSRACRLGQAWLGCEGKVYGSVDIVGAQPLTEQEFRDKGALHHWPGDEPPPYNKIVGWALSGARALETRLPYWRPRAAIGWNVFREKEEDLPIQGRRKRAFAPESNAVDGEGVEQAQGEQNKAQAGLKRQWTTQLDEEDEEDDGTQDDKIIQVGEPSGAADPRPLGE